MVSSSLHLRAIECRPWPERLAGEFPFCVPVVGSLQHLEFSSPVTFFVGENGTGKSTLLEAMAVVAGLPTVGSEAVHTDPALARVREFAHYLKLIWNRRVRRGFFLRAEDFFGYARKMARTREELRRELDAVDREYTGRSEMARNLARMPYLGEIHAIDQRYGAGLDALSHGESFLRLFQERFVPGGLYLLDEPEAPLSPVRQMALLAMIHQMVKENGQFIIATHAPILMSYPGATLLALEGGEIHPIAYKDLEHVQLTRDFLTRPEVYLRRLGIEDEDGGGVHG